ncbi:LOW QUALITY PROTEIN: proliferation marker protein Ki-67 [Pteronotus mesoamericanus]|uniref:LOW QUALITY PROTEIN: proliferation marker protein Ki-67 n=1 Tax=Pteronotus mesoamericanus TaxID=1884717 RepID=UPI0023EAF502|nr:LOW QUALITY PROTEIN: proliferation marker protein Ki-67 [Pteronotus parnellii mesoamericanus]
MGPTGRLVTIKRSGVDGPHFPLSLSTCLFGRGIECDIRIQLPVVSKQHCKIEINEQKAVLFNFSSANPTQVNGSAIDGPVQLRHGDLITIVDRSFRYENERHQNGSESTESPGQRLGQAPARRASRSSFSSDPCGKGEARGAARPQLPADGVSGGSPARTEDVAAARAAPRSSEGPDPRTTPDVHGSEPPRENRRNAAGPPAGGSREGARGALVSRNGGLEPLPATQSPEEGGANESPFRKLYESMKEELDVKSEKENVLQNRRKSGSWDHCAAESESAGGSQGQAQLQVTPKSRRRSRRSSQTKAVPGPTLEATVSSSTPPTETAIAKTPVPWSHQNSSRKRQSGGQSVIGGSNPVNPDQSEGFQAEHTTFTPQPLFPGNRTPSQGDSANGFRNTPEKGFSRKRRRSLLPDVDGLAKETETPKQAALTALLVPVEQKGSAGSPGLSSVDVSNLDESIHKMEGLPSKRRRVSFGGHLRPELFDENLPPNTPLKRGETPVKRRSLVARTPAVLKKIIKEQPQESGKEESSEIRSEVTAQNVLTSSLACHLTNTPSGASDGRRGPSKPPASGGSQSPHQTDAPKRGGRRSGGVPAERASGGRSQHGLLQAIRSRRRSGASEANLIVAKSWADIVKLSARQTQSKVVKHRPLRQLSKRQRKIDTPKKPTGRVHNEFSTGHANSPCTIVIGKAHIEKVAMPARPYRMLNNFVLGRKIDFNEDLSGLTEMFKTPAKEKPKRMSLCPTALSNSEDLLGKKFQVPKSEEKPLLCTPEKFGENVFPRAQNVPQEPSDKKSESPSLRRQHITVNKNMKTPPSETEPPKAASSANKSRRSVGPRNTQAPGTECGEEDTEVNTVESILGRRLRKLPAQAQLLEGEMKESERAFETCKRNIESKEDSEKMIVVRRSRRSSEPQCAPRTDVNAMKRLQEIESKEDLVGIHSFLQTPGHAEGPVYTESKTTMMRCKSPKPEPISTPTKMNVRIKMPSQSVNVDILSVLRKLPQTPGDTKHTREEPVGGDENMKPSNEVPEQQLDSAEQVTGSRRRSRTPKRKAQPLEDLTGFKELFQTPNHVMETVTDDKPTKMPSKSPKPEPVSTPTKMNVQIKMPSQNVNVEAYFVLRKPTQTPGDTKHTHKEPVGGDESMKASNETPEQQQDLREHVIGSRRRSRTPLRKAQPLEDLSGFKELFQTPNHVVETVTDDKPTKMLSKSPKPKQVSTPTSTKRCLRTPLGKVDVPEELSALRKPTPTPGGTTHSQREPEGDDEDVTALNRTPEQKWDSAEHVTGSRRRSRTPMRRVQPQEDLSGFKELFQTPNHIVEIVTDDKTTKKPTKSPQAQPVSTPTSTKRRLRTPLGKVDVPEELSALRKPTPTPGGTTHSQREPEGDDEDVTALNRTPEQKWDSAEHVTGSRRRSRTPLRRVQPLEDLSGFKELFQTPNHIVEIVTDDKPTKKPSKSPKPQPVSTPTSTKRRLRTPLGKVDVPEELSALRKPTPTPGGTTHSQREPEGDDEDVTALNRTPEQKWDSAEHVTGSRRRSRTPMRRVQPQEDLSGFKELFQTPNHVVETVTDDKPTKMLSKSPKPKQVSTPTSTKRRPRTPLGKVDVPEELSALRKPTPTQGGTTHSQREPEGDDEDVTALNRTPEQKWDSAEHVTGSRRRSRTPLRRVQPLEDLSGFKELFQTPNHTDEPITEDTTTAILCQSSQPEPVVTSTSMTRQFKIPLGKVDVEQEFSAVRKSTPTSGKTTCLPRDPVGDDKAIKALKGTPEQQLDSAEHATGSGTRSRTPKRKVEPIEDLTSFKELFQTPNRTEEQMTEDKTMKMPCKSPREPVSTPASTKRHLGTPLGNVEVELSALRKPTPTPGGTTSFHRELEGDDEDIKALKETLEQKLDSAEHKTGSRRRSRTPKKVNQLIEDLVGLKELFQTPHHTVEPMTEDKATKMPCKSPQAKPVVMPTSRNRRLKAPPGEAAKDEPSALRRPTRTSRKTTQPHKEPQGVDKDIKLSKEPPEQKLDPAENVTGSKRRPRTRKEKAQFLENPASLKELFQTPNHTEEPVAVVSTAEVPSRSPQPEAVVMPARTRRQLKAPPGTGEGQEAPSALRGPTRTAGKATRSYREPEGGDKDMQLSKESPEEKLDPAENAAGGQRRPRTRKEKARLLEGPASLKELFQAPDHTEEPVAVGTTEVPSRSPQPEAVVIPARTRRQLKAPPGTGEGQEAPSALRRPTRTSGKDTLSHTEPVDGANDIKVCKESPRQEPGPVRNTAGSRRLLRSRKGTAPAQDSPVRSEQPLQSPAEDEEGGTDGADAARTSTQTPDRSKPVTTSRRALRARNVKPTEEPADCRDPVKSGSKSGATVSPKKKREDESCVGPRRLRTRACDPDTAEEQPPRKRQRVAPREQRDPPEPSVPKKGRRVLAESTEPVDDLPSTNGKTKNRGQKGDETSADKEMSLRSSVLKKTNGAEPRPELLGPAEKVKRKRNEKKPANPSPAVEIQHPEGGAQSPGSGDKAQAKRVCPRPGRRGKVPEPRGAGEKARASSVETPGKTRKEKEGPPRAGSICLRSRRVTAPPSGDTSESESKQRVTRSGKRPVEDANKASGLPFCFLISMGCFRGPAIGRHFPAARSGTRRAASQADALPGPSRASSGKPGRMQAGVSLRHLCS